MTTDSSGNTDINWQLNKLRKMLKNANEELFEYFNAKDDSDTAFWHAWRKKYCSSSLKTTSTLNGKQGDANVCNEFTEQFRSVFQTNTVNSDCVYEAEFSNMDFASEETNFPRIDIDLCRQCIGKMKLNKGPGVDDVSTEHLLYGAMCSFVSAF